VLDDTIALVEMDDGGPLPCPAGTPEKAMDLIIPLFFSDFDS